MDITKIRKRWQPEELHQDTTLDYAISEIYKLCDLIEQLQAENERLKLELAKLIDLLRLPSLFSLLSQLEKKEC